MKIEFDENAIEEAVEEMERSPEFNRMMWRTRWRNRYQKAKRSSCCILKTLHPLDMRCRWLHLVAYQFFSKLATAPNIEQNS